MPLLDVDRREIAVLKTMLEQSLNLAKSNPTLMHFNEAARQHTIETLTYGNPTPAERKSLEDYLNRPTVDVFQDLINKLTNLQSISHEN